MTFIFYTSYELNKKKNLLQDELFKMGNKAPKFADLLKSMAEDIKSDIEMGFNLSEVRKVTNSISRLVLGQRYPR